MDDQAAPWTLEGVLVDHPSFGRGRLVAEPNSGWFHFIPVGSGPFIAISVCRVLSQVRVVPPEEMTDEDHDELDWASARWTPLADENPALADELAHVVVGSFFTAARLDYRRRDEALTQLQLNVGHTPKGVRILQAVLPIGAGEHLYEWDGTAAAARAIAVGAGESAGRTIIVDRAGGSPCGWEPPDLPARRKD